MTFPRGYAADAARHRPANNELTTRERTLIALLAQDKPVKAASSEIGITEKTGHYHLASIKRKLRCNTLAGVACWAIRNELIPIQ